MKIKSYYPVLAVGDVANTVAFYKTTFGFVPAFESDWYVHLTMPDNEQVNLAILDARHETIPAGFNANIQGVILNFEYEEIDAYYDKLNKQSVDIVQEIRDEDFGQRHFILRDPNGILIDIIKPIPPQVEYASQYEEGYVPS